MPQPITAALTALVTSKLRAGPSRGFRGRVAIGASGSGGGCYGLLNVGTEGSAQATIVVTPGTVSTRWQVLVRSELIPLIILNVHADNPTGGSVVKTLVIDESGASLGAYSGGPVDGPETLAGIAFGGGVYIAVQIDADGTAHAKAWNQGDSEPGSWLLEGDVDIVTSIDYTGPTLDTFRVFVAGDALRRLEIDELRVWVDGVEQGDPYDDFQRDGSQDDFGGDWTSTHSGFDAIDAIVCRVSQPARRITIDRTRRLGAAQLDVEFTNETGEKGFYTQLAANFVPNAPIQVFQWYGDPANEVCTFTGLVDRLHEHRDPKTVSLVARSRMKWLIEQGFSAIGSQDPTDPAAILTEDNGVYTNMEVSAIVDDILTRAGWPSADRDIVPTTIILALFVIPDLTSWIEAISGSDRLTAVSGYDLVEDELGVMRFRPSPLMSATEPTPDLTFTAGVDIMALDHEVDDIDRKTRVRVSGPMTSSVPAWDELWATTRLSYPVGVWHDPADPGNVRVIDAITKYLYTLRQSDRTVVSQVHLAAPLAYYPGGLSGDPLDASIYWVLDIDWIHGGSDEARIRKFDKATNALLDTYVLADGQWTDLKSDGVNLWATRFDTDRLYKLDITDGSVIASYTYAGKTNPTGMYLVGTTIALFFNNGAAFYLVDTSAPATITGHQSTAGTHILGGEIEVSTGQLFAVAATGSFGNSAGYVWKFALSAEVTNGVARWASDAALEDQLGEQSGIAPRPHDLHSFMDAHPFETRVLDISLQVVTSLAQAQDVANRTLARAKRLRRGQDVAWVGRPDVQINDVLEVLDPVSAVTNPWVLDTYRSDMVAGPGGTYVGSGSTLPWEPGADGAGETEGGGAGGGGAGGGSGGGGDEEPPPVGSIPPNSGVGDLLDWDAADGVLAPFVKQTYPNDHPGDLMIEYGIFDEGQVFFHADGYLVVNATRQGDGTWLFGMVATFIDDGGPTYTFSVSVPATITFVARFNIGVGAWQALWLLAAWAAPEIDIAEVINQMITANLHGSSDDGQHMSEAPFPSDEWHEYELERTATDLTFRIDGVDIVTVTVAMLDDMPIIMDSKVGLTAPDGTTPSPIFLHVASVKVSS